MTGFVFQGHTYHVEYHKKYHRYPEKKNLCIMQLLIINYSKLQ